MILRIAALLALLSPLALGQQSQQVSLYKIRAAGAGSPKEIDERLDNFGRLFNQMSYQSFELIEKDTRSVAVGSEATFRLSEAVTLTITIVEQISPEKLRVKVLLYNEVDEEVVISFKMAIKLETPFMVDAPEGLLPEDRLLLGLDIR